MKSCIALPYGPAFAKMKPISEKRALEKLLQLQTSFADHIRRTYEHRAKDCVTCETPGACCLDAHFVNVGITRLEAVAIAKVVSEASPDARIRVRNRIGRTIDNYALDTTADSFSKMYACPLHGR